MEQDILLDVLVTTPEGVRYEHHATSVTVPTIEGPYTFLRNHTPIIMPLKIGAVRVRRTFDDETSSDYIAISSGIVEVSDNVVNIVVNTAERARDIDISRAEDARIRAEELLAQQDISSNEMQRVRIALNKAINRIGVADHKR
ncbi:F0F1 ATP synthase subunit epsilon [Atopobacter phocae]|uniref:F0F1 ATP synthase subunit epsilon n=1 Tax=Atopobacter phocae TaxID=136492 RepID=UPI000472B7EC|nr:F0F1 ATP synthase subunit epsilon [Atopobacter phocae]